MNNSRKNYALRGLLIILVVLGHLLTKNPLFPSKRVIYIFIYSFHMPLFFMLSGYYGYSIINYNNKTIIKSTIHKLLIPFIISSITYRVASYYIIDMSLKTDIFKNPTFALWFLLALSFYRVISKYIVRIPHYMYVVLLISIFAHYFPMRVLEYLDFPRILSFMIYYFIGLELRANPQKFKHYSLKYKNALFALIGSLLICELLNYVDYRGVSTFLRQTDVDFFRSIPIIQYFVYRILAIVIALTNCIIIYSLIKPNIYLEYIGKKSMNIFLGHIYFIMLLKTDTYQQVIAGRSDIFEILVIVIELCLIISIILVLSKMFQYIKNKIYLMFT